MVATLNFYGGKIMARRRYEGDVKLDFRGKDFSKMTEKGVGPVKLGQPLKTLELFGGCSAPRRALVNVGYNIKAIDYVELLPYAVQAYNSIFDCGYKPSDIRIWNMSPDIVIHGSPCQDWSNEGFNNVNSGRSILFERVLQILDPEPADGFRELTRPPKVVLWENVPKLKWSYKDVLDYYIDVMSEFGYVSYFDILEASDYGIPQDRKRLFVVSILKEQPGADKFVFPKKIPLRVTLKDIVDTSIPFDRPDVALRDAERGILFHNEDGALCVREATKLGYKPVGDWQVVNLSRPNSSTRRGRVGDRAKTITCGARQGICYDGQVRMLSAKEYLLLMGFGAEDYKKMSSAGITDMQIIKLAGNSICVPVLEALFKSLIDIGVMPLPESTY